MRSCKRRHGDMVQTRTRQPGAHRHLLAVDPSRTSKKPTPLCIVSDRQMRGRANAHSLELFRLDTLRSGGLDELKSFAITFGMEGRQSFLKSSLSSRRLFRLSRLRLLVRWLRRSVHLRSEQQSDKR